MKFFKKMQLRRRRKKYIKAYMILRKIADRHEAAGHLVEFKAINEVSISMNCYKCPNLYV